MIRGSIGDHVLSIRFEKDLKDKDEDGEEQVLEGECVNNPTKGHIAVAINSECSGLGLFNAVCHELVHGAEYVYGFDIPHSTVYVIASGLCQALISTGLVKEDEFEARLRRLMMESEGK